MTALPADLKTKFQTWDDSGRPQQVGFEWKTENWRRYLRNSNILDSLPNPIDRRAVIDTFRRIYDSDSALDAFIASYLWGYAKAGFGPYRAERVIRLNNGPERGKDFAAELFKLAMIAMEEGGVAAYEHIVSERRRDRHFFAQWGPAFATKFISYATQASDKVGTTPILDAIVSEWFGDHCTEIGRLWLTWHSAGSYRRYTDCMAEWANELSIEPEQVEQLIFNVR
ncbi:hypothetical protein [Specibacter sp. NPDC078709]|uniref:8-oxoguanine DNA glycosylase OGG fold protein n=1 Tax=Specibacter sp. NPDC078709 TaxID=3154364 RepID=UPI003430BD57